MSISDQELDAALDYTEANSIEISPEEMRAALTAAANARKSEGVTGYDEAAAAAWAFVRPKLLEQGREKGFAGVWSDGFRQGWQSAERALSPLPVVSSPVGVTEAVKAFEDQMNKMPTGNPYEDCRKLRIVGTKLLAALNPTIGG